MLWRPEYRLVNASTLRDTDNLVDLGALRSILIWT